MRTNVMKRLMVAIGTVTLMVLAPGAAMAVGPQDGLTIPSQDPALVFVAPTPDQPNYSARVDAFLTVTVPETFGGQPVQFLSAYTDAGGADALGMPTSAP